MLRELNMVQEEREVLDAHVALDTPCVGCGYNLKTMAVGGNCPECGRSVEHALRAPLGTWAARPLRVAACLMTTNALVFSLGLYCHFRRPSYDLFARIGTICVAPALSMLLLGVLTVLAGRLYFRHRKLLVFLAPAFAWIFTVGPSVATSNRVYTTFPTALVIHAFLVGPAWLGDIMHWAVSEGKLRSGMVKARMRVAQYLSWGMLFLGALSVCIEWKYPSTRNYKGLVGVWYRWELGSALGLMNLAASYCVGRIASDVARELRECGLPLLPRGVKSRG